ncbi:AbrB/MazE/SpoVT family DNA-binding domain-containing protein [Rhizobium leguminosarum]|uniref:AbrB/MazE/SpoVT family DNA-binding domain-containing protein n=1 Tax=Rhizobium leguminosarum TaxID=384 RepID=UPI0036DF4EA5
MATSAKVTSKNQITLPAGLRKSLDIHAGDRIDFVAEFQRRFRGSCAERKSCRLDRSSEERRTGFGRRH